MSFIKNLVALLGRWCFSLIFIFAGISKIMNFHATATQLSGVGLPFAEFLLVVAIVFELLGALLIFLGWFTRFGAFLLFIFILVVSYFLHAFWNMEGPAAADQLQQALKNLSMLGGTLILMAFGAGKASLDALRHREKDERE